MMVPLVESIGIEGKDMVFSSKGGLSSESNTGNIPMDNGVGSLLGSSSRDIQYNETAENEELLSHSEGSDGQNTDEFKPPSSTEQHPGPHVCMATLVHTLLHMHLFGVKARAVIPHLTRIMSGSTTSMMVDEQRLPENNVQQIELLTGTEDSYGGVRVEIKNRMDSIVFGDGTKGVWIKLPIQHANLVEAAVKEGFWYHHAEPDYLMLVLWIPKTAHTLPANASHRVGIGAFVINGKREVLVVQENSGRFKGTGVWKLPTGVVNEGEDICTAAIREVEEETGIKTEFVEILAFRQSHKAFFTKSDLFFVCMLQPLSTEIQKQEEELEAAQWMAMEEYAAQPFVKKNPLFDSIANICLAKKDMKYTGFSPFSATSSSGKTNILYFNNQDLKQPLSSGNQA
ncbi:hypothetical protein AAG906_040488 [Vitis piasezkii]